MAAGTVSKPGYVDSLAAALIRDMPGAEVTTEQVRGDRYRFVVVWDQFNGVGHPERQERVWRIVEQTLSRDDLLKVAMIVTIAADELGSWQTE